MMPEVNNIIKAIPLWSKKLQGNDALELSRELKSAHNFITDYSGNNWTYGKSVGDNGSYHSCGGAARIHLENLGFIDVLSSTFNKTKIRNEIENKFREWAVQVKPIDLNKKLDRYLNGKLNVKFRLMIPPDF